MTKIGLIISAMASDSDIELEVDEEVVSLRHEPHLHVSRQNELRGVSFKNIISLLDYYMCIHFLSSHYSHLFCRGSMRSVFIITCRG